MSKEYPGESPSKTIARQLFWEQVIRRIGHDKAHLVLCGPDAGDVRLLCAIHKPRTVIAVDKNVEALEKANKQISNDYPALLMFGDITKFRWSHKFDCVFLDWCSNLNGGSIKKTFEIMDRHLKPDGCFAVGFQAAREHRMITSRFGRKLECDVQRIQLFKSFAAEKGYDLVWCCSYVGTVPMIYMLFRKAGVEAPANLQIIRAKATREEIVERAKFSMKTRSCREIEDVYCLPRFTAAGWKAAETRKNKVK